MARAFDGTSNGLITAQILSGMSGMTYGTAAACARVRSAGATGASPVFCMGTTSTADTIDNINVYYSNSNAYGAWDGASDSIGTFGTTLDRWHVVAITKATGTVAPRVHTFVPTAGTWSHVAAGTAIGDASAASWLLVPGIAAYTSLVDIAAYALWDKRAMSDGETERLASGLWTKLSPDTLIEYPSGRDFPAEVHADHGRSRVAQTSVGSGVARFNGAGPPGFRFSPMSRRR